MGEPLSGGELDAFLAEAEEAARAYTCGDMERYLELVHRHADPLVAGLSLDELMAMMRR